MPAFFAIIVDDRREHVILDNYTKRMTKLPHQQNSFWVFGGFSKLGNLIFLFLAWA